MSRKLPQLSPQEVRQIASASNVALGTELAQRGAVEDVRAKGKSVSASVQDSEGAWQVRLLVGSDGVEEATCTCEQGQSAVCCHAVALMLALAGLKPGAGSGTASAEPGSSEHAAPNGNRLEPGQRKTPARTKAPSLEQQLRERPAPELVELLLHLVEKDAKLKPAIEIWLRGGLAPKDLTAIRNAVAKEWKRFASGGRATQAQVVKAIQPHLKHAESLQESAPGQAGSIYAAIMQGMLSLGGLPYAGRAERLSNCADEVAAQLANLAAEVDAATAIAWRSLVWNLFRVESEMGDDNRFPRARQALLDLPPHDWQLLDTGLEADVREKWEKLSAINQSRYHDFGWAEHSVRVDFWAARLARYENAAAATEMVAQFGAPPQRYRALLERKDFESALGLLREYRKWAGQWSVNDWAQRLVEVLRENKQLEQALRVASEFELWDREFQLKLDLDHPDAAETAVRYLLTFPTPNRWEQIMALTPPHKAQLVFGKMWEAVQDEQHIMLRIQVLLWLRHWKAIRTEIVNAATATRKQVANAVIGAVLENEPQIGMALLQEHVEFLLSTNQETIPYDILRALQDLRSAHKKNAMEDEWLTYVKKLRARPDLPSMLPQLMRSYRLLN